MPQPDFCRRREIDGLPVRIAELAVRMEPGAFPAVFVAEYPDEPAPEETEQRMIDVVPPPVRETHRPRLGERRFEPVALREIHLLQLPGERGYGLHLFR